MNQDQLDGMQARATGEKRICTLSGSRKEEWLKGFDLMDIHIGKTLNFAQQMLDGILAAKQLARPRYTSRYAT